MKNKREKGGKMPPWEYYHDALSFIFDGVFGGSVENDNRDESQREGEKNGDRADSEHDK